MMQIETIKLSGITGDSCAEKINSALLKVKGVNDISISLEGSKATVQFDEDLTSLQELQTILVHAGYTLVKAGYSEVTKEKSAGSCCGGCGGSGHH